VGDQAVERQAAARRSAAAPRDEVGLAPLGGDADPRSRMKAGGKAKDSGAL
jgi:hypothetical protein